MPGGGAKIDRSSKEEEEEEKEEEGWSHWNRGWTNDKRERSRGKDSSLHKSG